MWHPRDFWRVEAALANETCFCSAFDEHTFFFFSWQDAIQESIPIMLVGNKADLRDAATAEEQKCVPGYLGEKLAMVRAKVGMLG